MYLCVGGAVFVSAVSIEAQREQWIPGAGVSGSSGRPHMGPGNLNLDPLKNRCGS